MSLIQGRGCQKRRGQPGLANGIEAAMGRATSCGTEPLTCGIPSFQVSELSSVVGHPIGVGELRSGMGDTHVGIGTTIVEVQNESWRAKSQVW